MKQKVLSIKSRLKSFFKKCKSTELEFSPACFISITKTVINHKFDLDQSFQQILCRIDGWINKESGWIIESNIFQPIDH